MILLQFFKSKFQYYIRYTYWIYRLSKVKFDGSKRLQFPLKIEGKGEINFGHNSYLQSGVFLGVSSNSYLEIGVNSYIEKCSSIIIGNNSKLNIGNDFKIGSNAKLSVINSWNFGDGVKIETNCSIGAREPSPKGILNIGDGTHIGDFTIIDVVDNVTIGNNVAIGPNCTIYSHDHIYDNINVPAWKGGVVSKPVNIGDGAWIGSGVTILPGVNIGIRTVVAAGSVVTKSLEANSIYGGIPAKFIKSIQ